MAENEAHNATRKEAGNRLWQRGERAGAGALRRSRLLTVRPRHDGRPDVWLQVEHADYHLLRTLTWCSTGALDPGPLDHAFADVLPHFTGWPVIHFEVVDRWPRVA